MARVPRTRNGNTWTESMYWSAIRSALRGAFRYWKPAMQAKMNARTAVKGKGRQKWKYKCAVCNEWFKDKEIQIDHIIPVGSLKGFDDLEQFVKNLTPESPKDYQILCKECHLVKTNKERKKKK